MDILLGLQWGDEGKGKVVDYLAPRYQMVARFQGGPNAGHTLVHNGIKHVLHQVPSGIFHPTITNGSGNGVVLDAVVFGKEIAALKARGLEPVNNLIISKKAHLIVPTHRLLDAASEAQKGINKIGSTLRGIGPAYQDKYARHGLRVGDLLSPDFNAAYARLRQTHLHQLAQLGGDASLLPELEAEWHQCLDLIRSFRLEDTEYLLNDALQAGQAVLAEGAQGSLLDIDFGSYPYVTSSSTMAAGACTGLGVAPKWVRHVFGVFKAYCTRVGSGPFPTELHNEIGEQIRRQGFEFGSTTGRPRRTGWLDVPALRYAAMTSGVTHLLMMKADVLSGLDTLEVCTAYETDGQRSPRYPAGAEDRARPLYEAQHGWQNLGGVYDSLAAMPRSLQAYVAFIEKQAGLPISMVSTGPDRVETVMCGELA